MINKKIKHKNNPIENEQGCKEAILRRNEKLLIINMKRCSPSQVSKKCKLQLDTIFH